MLPSYTARFEKSLDENQIITNPGRRSNITKKMIMASSHILAECHFLKCTGAYLEAKR